MQEKWSRAIAYSTRAAVSVAVLALGVSIFTLLERTRPQVPRTTNGPLERLVEVMVAQPVATARLWEGFGAAEARDMADIAAELPVMVVERPDTTEPGQPVLAGQILFRLEDHDYVQEREIARQNLARLEAQRLILDAEKRNWTDQLELSREEVAVARMEFEAASEALARGAGNPIEVDRRRREHNAALRALRTIEEQVQKIPLRRAELDASTQLEAGRIAIAQRNVERCTIRSPIDGILQDVRVHAGERVVAGQVVARVVSLRRIRVPLRLPQTALGSVRPGDRVELSAETLGWNWAGVIERLAPEAEASTRTLTVFVQVIQDEGETRLLVPGQFVKAVVTSASIERFVVPRDAVSGDCVFLDLGGLVVRRPVVVDYHVRGAFPQLHPTVQEWVVLGGACGLEAGDRVILQNVEELRVGERVVSAEAANISATARSAPAGQEAQRPPGP